QAQRDRDRPLGRKNDRYRHHHSAKGGQAEEEARSPHRRRSPTAGMRLPSATRPGRPRRRPVAKARDHLWTGMQVARSPSIPSTATAEQQKQMGRRCRPPRIGQVPPKTDASSCAPKRAATAKIAACPLRTTSGRVAHAPDNAFSYVKNRSLRELLAAREI